MIWLQSSSKPHDTATKMPAVTNKRKIVTTLFWFRSNLNPAATVR